MNIYTGYFGQLRKYNKLGMVPVSISCWNPSWYEGDICKELAPPEEVLSSYKYGKITEKQFTKSYLCHLRKLNWGEVINRLYDISDSHNGADVVLLCYERPTDFCHRKILSAFLIKNGINCEEANV